MTADLSGCGKRELLSRRLTSRRQSAEQPSAVGPWYRSTRLDSVGLLVREWHDQLDAIVACLLDDGIKGSKCLWIVVSCRTDAC